MSCEQRDISFSWRENAKRFKDRNIVELFVSKQWSTMSYKNGILRRFVSSIYIHSLKFIQTRSSISD